MQIASDHVEPHLRRLELDHRSSCRRARTCASSRPVRRLATAMATVPTGFCGVPPVGPAMPVMPTPIDEPVLARTPSASAAATGSLTAPCAAISSGGTPAEFDLQRVAVGTRRRRARTPSCPARRSAATSSVRPCTTQPPRSSACRSSRSWPTISSIDRPSVLKTSARARRASRRVAAASARRAASASADRVTRCSSICPGAARIVVSIGGRGLQPLRVDRLRQLLDVRLSASDGEKRRAKQPLRHRRALRAAQRRARPSSASARAAVPAGGRRAGARPRPSVRAQCRWDCRGRRRPR